MKRQLLYLAFFLGINLYSKDFDFFSEKDNLDEEDYKIIEEGPESTILKLNNMNDFLKEKMPSLKKYLNDNCCYFKSELSLLQFISSKECKIIMQSDLEKLEEKEKTLFKQYINILFNALKVNLFLVKNFLKIYNSYNLKGE
jgi:hypothetical protein